MEKTIIRKSNESKTGYELVVLTENGEQIHPLNEQPKNEPFTLILPENPSNRKYFNIKKVEAAGGEIELSYKATIKLGERTESEPRKSLEDYLDDEDKKLYLELVEKAKKNRAEAHKRVPLTPLELAMRKLERAKLEVQREEEKLKKKED